MRKLLSILSLAAAVAAAPVALHATPISGTLAAGGTDTFTTNTITFFSSTVGGGPGANTGTFGTYLTDGNPINFLGGPLPYLQGQNLTPGGSIQFFTTSENGENFAFYIQNYDAELVSNVVGCTVGVCLDATGNGFFTATGAVDYDPTPGSFSFTSQMVNGQTTTTFSASAIASPSAVPEPSTLMLMGSGFLGLAGVIRKKLTA